MRAGLLTYTLACASLGALAMLPGCVRQPPLHVPGPTTVHPPGYSLVETPPPVAGVRSVIQRTVGSNVVAFRVVFAAGSADDPAGKEGLTHLAAHAMAEGGTATLSYTELVDKLYPLAASIDVHVDRDETVFTAEVTRSSLAAFSPLLEEVILAPRLDADGFGRVHAQAVSLLTDDLRGSNDEALGKEALQALIYQGHPYAHPTLGTEHGLASSTLEDVKAQRARVFCRDRVTVGIAGDLPEGFAEKLTRDLAGLPACDGARPSLPPPKKLSGLHVVLIDKPSADATAVSLGYAYDVTRSSPDFPAVAFFADYLGLHRQSSGRLYQELREKRGLNYGDYAYAEHFAQDGDSTVPRPNVARRQQMFSLWLRPVKPVDAPFALRAALREYTGLLAHGVPASELARYRTFLTRVGALEELTPSRRLGYAIDDVTYGATKPYLEAMREGWGALDEAKLADAITRHLTGDDLCIAIVTHDAAALAASLVAGTPARAPAYDAPKPAAITAADAEIVRFPLKVPAENIKVIPVADVFKD